MRLPRRSRGVLRQGAGHLPLFIGRAESGVQRGARSVELQLPLLVDDVDLGVVGDGFQREVRDPFQHEALADVAVERPLHGRTAADLSLLGRALPAVAQQIGRMVCGHEARACDGQGEAMRVFKV